VALDAGHRLDDDALEVLGVGGGFELIKFHLNAS
jgi:hypothetical protein